MKYARIAVFILAVIILLVACKKDDVVVEIPPDDPDISVEVEIPVAVFNQISGLNTTGFYFERFDLDVTDNTRTLVLDMPSWLNLYQLGILTDHYSYKNLNEEVFEVLLPANLRRFGGN